MIRLILVAVVCAARVVGAQSSARLQRIVEDGDSAALRIAVHDRPNDARDLLADLMVRSVPLRNAASDSLLELSFRVAAAYAAAWRDSFPLWNLQRFTRLTAIQRRAKAVADSLRLAGNRVFGMSGPLAAIRLWRAALARSLAVPDTAGAAAALGNIGAGLYRLEQFDSAQVYLEHARAFADLVRDKRTAANAVGTLGSIAKDRGALREAGQAYVRALELRTRIGDVVGASADHNNLGLIASALGDAQEARSHYTDALRIARDHDLADAQATALLNLGNLATSDANYTEATAAYREALRLYRTLGSDADAALVLQNLGRLALRTGDYSSAHRYLVEALARFRRAGTTQDLVQTRLDLASVAAARGDLYSALAELRRCQKLLDLGPASPALSAAVALARADILVQLNDYREAERQYDLSRALAHRAGDAVRETDAREGAAVLLLKRQDYARAEARLQVVERAQRANGDRRASALTRLLLGWTREQRQDTSGARVLITESRDSLHAMGDPISEASALVSLGDLELASRSPLAAESDYRRGLFLMRDQTAPAVAWQLHDGLARALRLRGATAAAAVELRQSITEVERVASSLTATTRRSIFLSDKWQPYEELALVERELGATDEAFAVSERMRARQMRELLARGQVGRPASLDSSVAAREQALRREIAELTQRLENGGGPTLLTLRGPDMGDAASGVVREALAHAQEEYEHILISIEDVSDRSPRVTDVMPWRAVADLLGKDQALLEYLLTDSTTLVFVVRRDTVRSLELGVGRKTLASLVDFARGTIEKTPHDRGAFAWRSPMRRLYRALIAPVEDAGLLSGVRRLVLVPHGELHYLPFAALIGTPSRDEFLVERYDIGYAPSASLWVQLTKRGAPPNASVLALAPRAKTLPGSRQEVEAIGSLYGRNATVLTDQRATEEAFRASAGQFGTIHLASYGVMNQHNPLFSFVELNRDATDDGRLEVHEVYGLTLHARLVILSACQTALASGIESDLPAGDDWVGLVRAFLSAGAEQVAATLWAVEDRSTAALMNRLHQHLRAGDAVVHAVAEAQRETLRNSATAGPFYWAGIVLVGGEGGH